MSMNGRPTPRTLDELLYDHKRRIIGLERRLPRGFSLARKGTSAERDAIFGVPATDAQRVALANASPRWLNTATGWDEGYYAVTGLSGLTVRGLVAGSASGWYPVGRADYAIAAKRNGYQSIGSGASALIDGMTIVRERGSITLTSNRLVLPRAGEYDMRVKFYVTGGYFSVTAGCNLTGTAPDTNNAGGLPSLVGVTPANNIDHTFTAIRTGIHANGATVGLAVSVNAIYNGTCTVWGDASNAGAGTALEMAYVGPPLADG